LAQYLLITTGLPAGRTGYTKGTARNHYGLSEVERIN
jgi:hypothetical protein